MKSIPWYKRIPIQLPMILLLIILIPTVAFNLHERQVSRETSIQNAKSQSLEYLREAAYQLETAMEQVETCAKALSEQSTFLELVHQYQQRPDDSILRSQITLLLGQSAWPCQNISGMYLITDSASEILTSIPENKSLPVARGQGLLLLKFYQEQNQGQATWSMRPGVGLNGNEIIYWRPLYTAGGEPLGILACQMETSCFTEALSVLCNQEDTISAITSYSGTVLYCTSLEEIVGKSLSGSQIFSQAYQLQENSGCYFTKNGNWMVAHYNALENGWKYLYAVPTDHIYGEANGWDFLWVQILSGFVGCLLGYILLFRLVIRPLHRLQAKMELMEKGKLETLDSYGTENEIGAILQAYDRMIVRLRKLINDVYVQQLLRKQAQLTSLHSQIDEHFLYNTLNTIYCQASQEQAHISASMILLVSRYFRLNLSEGKEKIPLSEILELLSAYLQIQQMRYGQSLECRLETFPGMEEYISLKYLYQPIIENAIVHGFEKKLGNHHLDIRFLKKEDRLCFVVADDGAGMTPEQCQMVLAGMDSFDLIQGKGYALRNLQEQIRLTYGPEYRIQIESQLGKGTRVTLEVPLERRPHEET